MNAKEQQNQGNGSGGAVPRSGHWTVGRAAFGSTRWSLVLQAGCHGQVDEAAVEQWCRAYWYSVYCFIRRQGKTTEDTRDLTQEFFSRLLEKQWLAAVEPGPARFRTWLLVVLKRFLADAHDYATAAKRGGGRLPLPVDVLEVEERLEREGVLAVAPEYGFDRQWAVSVMEQGLAQLQGECVAAGKAELFESLSPFLSRDPDPDEYS